jgi:hypothetical protein
MNLAPELIKDAYGNIITVGTTAGTPTTGRLQNGAGQDITEIDGSPISLPTIQATWNTGYTNLTNGADNEIPFDASTIYAQGTGSDYFFRASGRIELKKPGLYAVFTGIHLYDLQGNMDVTVKLFKHSASAGTGTLVTLQSDKRFAETAADQLISGFSFVQYDASNPWLYVAVNPSANSPFPSNSDSTPSFITIVKISN